MKTKFFQVKYVNWSKRYLGKVPRMTIAQIDNTIVLKTIMIYGTGMQSLKTNK